MCPITRWITQGPARKDGEVAGAPSLLCARSHRLAVAAAAGGGDSAKRTALVERCIDLLEAGNTNGLGKLLSPAFLVQGADGGVLDKDDFVTNPSKVADDAFTNVRATGSGTVLVVRYDVTA